MSFARLDRNGCLVPSPSIIGSLAGVSYFGPVAGHGFETHDLEMVRMERKKHHIEQDGIVGGDVQALPAHGLTGNYVELKKKPEERHDE